ncbi:MAG: SRPBCC family protein [Phenylobacterium sp.]|uniref:SRPBCC family protein n=1 Tax=Phenylobacterium sp. TaxID=1871053 RepID=UPI001A4AA8CF|nr:SRPBCC family protein [Phenylobacterium sp.]MBL8772227.1 SRPBCC family protein [Phenylobacterium sp.]
MKTLASAADIRAAPAVVWGVLTRFAAYPDWTAAVRVNGGLSAGADLNFAVTTATRRGASRIIRFMGTIEAVEPTRRLTWRVGVPFILHWRFNLRLEPRGATTHFTHEMEISGLGAVWAYPRLDRLVTPTLRRFVDDLKRQSERAQARARPGRRP